MTGPLPGTVLLPEARKAPREGGEFWTMAFCHFCMFIKKAVWILGNSWPLNMHITFDLCLLNYSRGLWAPEELTFWDYGSDSQLSSGLYFANHN